MRGSFRKTARGKRDVAERIFSTRRNVGANAFQRAEIFKAADRGKRNASRISLRNARRSA